MSSNGSTVAAFERELASYCRAKHCLALTNGTVTLEVALRAMGVKPGEGVATTALTMAATSIAILNVGATPVYHDVEPDTWLMNVDGIGTHGDKIGIPVSLYGLHCPDWTGLSGMVEDAAQTLRPHNRGAEFTSISFQQSKILSLGEGGALFTDDDDLARKARSIASLGYDLDASSSRIDKNAIKSPSAIRHVRYPAQNARMNDITAAEGLKQLGTPGARGPGPRVGLFADLAIERRRYCASLYRTAIAGCDWITTQHVPDGWGFDAWAYAVALDTPQRALDLQTSIVKHGGEMPYGCWQITYLEPAFRHLAPRGTCPIAEGLQPRILAFQTNNLQSAERNATALRRAIQEVEG